ncbi:TolC family protein [Bacteroidales bacterium OttesenSCG-928-J19]|nr:TolC family protein [Bacteroidales bacterium OttesenSCG-928-J19]
MNKSKYIRPLLLIIGCLLSFLAQAQERPRLTFGEYLEQVKRANIDYLVEKYNVEIAEANIKAAKVFPDPELSVSYSNNQNWDLRMGYGVDAELSYTLELGGKRKARIELARSEKEMTNALLEDYFRNLQADATIAYLTAIKQTRLYEIRKTSYGQMLELARADSLRFRLGAITETDARQSRLEAATSLNEVYADEGELMEALVELALWQGDKSMQLPDLSFVDLHFLKRNFDLSSLIIAAQNNRADLQAALKSNEVSQKNLRLAKAERAIDLGLSLGGSYASEVRNEIAPAPEFKGVSAGISIPLRFSNTNKGAVKAARLLVEQSERQYEAVELQIASEVVTAYNKYTLACRQVDQFDTGLLDEAEAIFQKKVYSYERGETSILEVITAHQTYNEVQFNYQETLYEGLVALVELERACGIWDIDL